MGSNSNIRDQTTTHNQSDRYTIAYGNFSSPLYADIRAEAFGEDIGQQSWLSAQEQDEWIAWLGIGQGNLVLDIACGSGGPTLRMAERTGCTVHGIDFEPNAIAAAQELARSRGLADRAKFTVGDASQPLDFPSGSFDAVVCIDAIGHFPNRNSVFTEWSRLLKPGGNLIFTDFAVVTGPLSFGEIEARNSSAFFLLVPPGFNEAVIAASGLSRVRQEDRTENVAKFAARRLAAREVRREALVKVESIEKVEREARILCIASTLASERRLSRFVYHARKSN
jgi:ubiquinone/menaquinone biosynthesis C-methylase UbiE